MWINPNADNTNQCKICPNCGQDNDRYGLPIYPFNKSTKVLNWCPKCLGTVEDITTVDRELPSAVCRRMENVGNDSYLWYNVNHFANVVLLKDRIIYSRDRTRVGVSFSSNNSLASKWISYYLRDGSFTRIGLKIVWHRYWCGQ